MQVSYGGWLWRLAMERLVTEVSYGGLLWRLVTEVSYGG